MNLETWEDEILNSSIAVWGTGAYGAMALQVLENVYNKQPNYFIDINKNNHGQDYLGVPVIAPTSLQQCNIDSY